MSEWTEEEMNYLRTAWAAGDSMGQIGKHVGRTRSAVAGKINSLNLPRRGVKVDSEEERREKKRLAHKAYNDRVAAARRKARDDARAAAIVAAAATAQAKAQAPVVEEPVSEEPLSATLPYEAARKHRECQFVVGDDFATKIREGLPIFCGRPVRGRSIYCSTHHRLCYRPVVQRNGGSSFNDKTTDGDRKRWT